MALPPFRLGAHDGRLALGSESYQPIERDSELHCLHMVGIAAKSGVAPAAVLRIGPRLAEPAKSRQMEVLDAMQGQEGRERVRGKVRMPPRARYRAHVGKPGDAVRVEQDKKFVSGASGMADREDL